MNEIRNSIVINNTDMYAFCIQAICEGYGFYGSPSNTGKKAFEVLDLMLEEAGLSYNFFVNRIQQVYQNILLYDNIYLGQGVGANFGLYGLEKLGSVYYDYFFHPIPGERVQRPYSTFSYHNRIPEYEDIYLEFLKPFVISLVYNDLTKRIENDVSRRLYNDQKALLLEEKMMLTEYIELVYNNIFRYVNMSPYLLFTYEFESGYPEYESMVTTLICGYAETVSNNFQKSAEYNAVITGLDINLSENIQQNINSECYSVLKIAYENVIGPLPAFSSLNEVLYYKKKYADSIRSLKRELSYMEYLIRNNEISAIAKAEHDISLAAKFLRNNAKICKISKWITYLSLPIGIAETLLNSSFLGLGLSAAGSIVQLASDYNDKKNNWLFLLRN